MTYWVINATLPPAMKYLGDDTQIAGRADGSGYDKYVYVSYYYDPNTGYNVTRISIVGFTGDPTNYTDVLKICNRFYNGILYAKLVAVGYVGGVAPKYIRNFRIYFASPTTTPNYVRFVSTAIVHGYAETGWVAIPYGQCATVGAYVVIDPQAYDKYTDGKTVLATYQVNVVFKTS